jgi:hypothetical protein
LQKAVALFAMQCKTAAAAQQLRGACCTASQHPAGVLQDVLHGALRTSNVLLTAQRRHQVADYALHGVSAGTVGAARNAEVGTAFMAPAYCLSECSVMRKLSATVRCC